MALDIYVGGFARYYALEWENVAQKWAKESGTSYRMIAPGGAPQPADWDEVADAVAHWRAAINQGLGDNIDQPIDWDESHDAPYFTDRPGYDGYGALVVWAAHAERGSTPPDSYDVWYEDEAFIECCEPKEGQKYRAIICGSLWLPGSFEFSFALQDLVGQDVHICSNRSLKQALESLNTNTFDLSAEQRQEALKADFGEEPSLETLARFGLALFHDLATQSVTHHLPIIMST
ncbi:MAG: hypothetical protein GC159_23190 [Phycisphaera sp.]|nr:hypothetical protein [Phycisphaera sp.]